MKHEELQPTEHSRDESVLELNDNKGEIIVLIINVIRMNLEQL